MNTLFLLVKGASEVVLNECVAYLDEKEIQMTKNKKKGNIKSN